MLGKLFGKKKNAALNEMKKIENRDLMEAIVGGCLLVAAADGEIEPEEVESLEKQLNSNPSLQHFGSEITVTINRFTEMLEANFRLGKTKILREIRDIKDNRDEAEEVFVSMIGIAESDGEIEPEEIVILKEVGKELNLRMQDFGLEAA